MKRLVMFMALLLFGAAFVGVLGPVSAKVTGDNCIETDHGTWCSQSVLADEQKFDGVAVGDADNDGKTDVVGVGLSGKVWMASKLGGEWVAKVLWESPGELIIPYVGDADNDGKNEVVVVGMVAGPEADTGAGQLTMIKGSGNNWQATRLFTDTHMLHGVAIGDADPDRQGNEIVTGGFNYNMTLVYKDGGTWKSEVMFTAGHKVRTVVVGDVDGDGKGEVVAASKDNSVYIVEKSGSGWANKTIFTDDKEGEARCGFGDFEGDGIVDIVAGGDSSQFAFIQRSGSNWNGNVIWTDSDKLRGAWIGDVYDGYPYSELISGGYSGNVTIHWRESGAWKRVQVFHDDNRLHHVISGDVDPDHAGLEIIAGGYGNKVFVIGQYHPNFDASMAPKGVSVTQQDEANFKVTLKAKDYYIDDIDLAVEGLPTGATATLSADPVTLTSEEVVVDVTIALPSAVPNGNTTFKIKATGEAGTKTVSAYINVDRQVMPKVEAPAIGEKVKTGQSVSYTFKVKNDGNIPDQFDIEAVSSTGIEALLSVKKTTALQPGESVNVLVTMKVPKDQKGKEDVLTFTAKSVFDGTKTSSATVTTTIKKEADGQSCGSIILFSTLLACVGMVGVAVQVRRRK